MDICKNIIPNCIAMLHRMALDTSKRSRPKVTYATSYLSFNLKRYVQTQQNFFIIKKIRDEKFRGQNFFSFFCLPMYFQKRSKTIIFLILEEFQRPPKVKMVGELVNLGVIDPVDPKNHGPRPPKGELRVPMGNFFENFLFHLEKCSPHWDHYLSHLFGEFPVGA